MNTQAVSNIYSLHTTLCSVVSTTFWEGVQMCSEHCILECTLKRLWLTAVNSVGSQKCQAKK